MAEAPERGQGAPRARGGPQAGRGLTRTQSCWAGAGAGGGRRDGRGQRADGRGRRPQRSGGQRAGERSAGLDKLPGGRGRAGGRCGLRGWEPGAGPARAVTAPRPARRRFPPSLPLHSGAPGRSAPPRRDAALGGECRGVGLQPS